MPYGAYQSTHEILCYPCNKLYYKQTRRTNCEMGRHLAQPLSFESHTDNTALCLPVTNLFYYAINSILRIS